MTQTQPRPVAGPSGSATGGSLAKPGAAGSAGTAGTAGSAGTVGQKV